MMLKEAVELLLEYLRRADISGISHREAIARVERYECGSRLIDALRQAERE